MTPSTLTSPGKELRDFIAQSMFDFHVRASDVPRGKTYGADPEIEDVMQAVAAYIRAIDMPFLPEHEIKSEWDAGFAQGCYMAGKALEAAAKEIEG